MGIKRPDESDDRTKIAESIATHLNAEVKKTGTLKQLAIRLGMRSSYLAMLCDPRNGKIPSVPVLVKMSKKLHISTDVLLGLSPNTQLESPSTAVPESYLDVVVITRFIEAVMAEHLSDTRMGYWHFNMIQDETGAAKRLFDQLWPGFKFVLGWASAVRRHELLVDTFVMVSHYLGQCHLWDDLLKYAQEAANAAQKVAKARPPRLYDYAWILIEGLGWSLFEKGGQENLEKSRKHIWQGLEVIRKNGLDPNPMGNFDLTCLGYAYLALIELHDEGLLDNQARIQSAQKYLNTAKDYAQQCKKLTPEIRARMAYIEGDIFAFRGDLLTAVKLYRGAKNNSMTARHRCGIALIELAKKEIQDSPQYLSLLEEAQETLETILTMRRGSMAISLLYAHYGLAAIAKLKGENMTENEHFKRCEACLAYMDPEHPIKHKLDELLK